MNKKIIAGALSLAVLSAAAVPVKAEEKPTPIEVSVPSSYILTIPAETNITFNTESTELNGVLKVKGNVLPEQSVKVTAETNALHNSTKNTDLPYTLKNNGNEFTSAVWNEAELYAGLEGDGKGKELQLSVAIEESDWDKAKAGTYEGSITFTAVMQEQ